MLLFTWLGWKREGIPSSLRCCLVWFQLLKSPLCHWDPATHWLNGERLKSLLEILWVGTAAGPIIYSLSEDRFLETFWAFLETVNAKYSFHSTSASHTVSVQRKTRLPRTKVQSVCLLQMLMITLQFFKNTHRIYFSIYPCNSLLSWISDI